MCVFAVLCFIHHVEGEVVGDESEKALLTTS